MIRQLVLAVSVRWLEDILVILLHGETNLTRKLKIYGPKIRCRKAAEGLTRRTRFSRYEKMQELGLIKIFT